jgi:tetratricopeptide (TPR) repeat protein
MGEQNFVFSANLAGPIKALPKRSLQISFPLPSPLLRAIGQNETPDNGLWSKWLAEWGWAWTITTDSCVPEVPLVNLWLGRSGLPSDFDARALALAVALQIRVDGKPLSTVTEASPVDLERVWRVISSLTQDALSEILVLALLRANSTIFNFNSVAPSWPSDVGLVIAERRALRDEREPAPIWLKSAYALLDEPFSSLRLMGSSLEECEEIWTSFANGRELPTAFEMTFWWEATYCLTERHQYEAAEITQKKISNLVEALEKMTGLIDPMWHHQRGRLYYYAGNHEQALSEFLREYKTHGEDLKVAAMLNREIANVLSDMVCLDAAKKFAERSVEIARSQGQKSELYRSLGRLAEIAIKQGDLANAENLLTESLVIQEKLGEENRSPAQTLTYLGHVALLNRDFNKASEFYDRATGKDADKSSLPYITMGRFALAAANNNIVGLEQLWNVNREKIELWAKHQTQILPAAVCTHAASKHIDFAKKKLSSVARSLLVNHYAIEAAYLLPDLLDDDQSQLKDDIVTMLNRWQKTLSAIPPELRESCGLSKGLSNFFEMLRHEKLNDDALLRKYSYPMALNDLEVVNKN